MFQSQTSSNIVYNVYENSALGRSYDEMTIKPDCLSNVLRNAIIIQTPESKMPTGIKA